jgi:glyoxylase-like metal-dependent hydrolase (beta-lactamase superfamily II)
MASLPPLQQFKSNTGARIYRIPVEAFPDFIAYCYVILEAGVPTLVDTGSGFGDSSAQLLRGMRAIREQFGEALDVTDIQRILITHGHIDHFGGAGFMQEQTGALIGIHELDRRVLIAHEERVILVTKDLRVYLERAGVKADLRQRLLDMYGIAKQAFRSVSVEWSLDDGAEMDGMRFIHTPGHCPGQVCILLGDVLLSADHVLARITPHQSPESIMPYTGLGHYFASLDRIAQVEGIRLALGGHEAPIDDFYERIQTIRASHERKLARTLELIRQASVPCTISELSKATYPERRGYDILLALEEVGAHVEYLYQHGQLAILNLDEIERKDNPALQYGIA